MGLNDSPTGTIRRVMVTTRERMAKSSIRLIHEVWLMLREKQPPVENEWLTKIEPDHPNERQHRKGC